MSELGYVNHIALVLDASGSMSDKAAAVIAVADNQIAYLATRSRELDQETRITVYAFDDAPRCLFYDKDVLRLPSLRSHYRTSGQTALIDATIKAMEDLARTPELYGDHAFLLYVLTDGYENASRAHAAGLKERIAGLRDNWTVAVYVPNQQGVFEAKKFGFPADNIALWSTTAEGMREVGENVRATTDRFMQARATGVRGYSRGGLFTIPTLDAKQVATILPRLDPSAFKVLYVADGALDISTFVERQTGRPYLRGSAYYELTKPEEVQHHKQVVVVHKRTGTAHAGAEARQLLGLPDYAVKVAPGTSPDYDVFVQSTSVNRKLVPGTRLIVL